MPQELIPALRSSAKPDSPGTLGAFSASLLSFSVSPSPPTIASEGNTQPRGGWFPDPAV